MGTRRMRCRRARDRGGDLEESYRDSTSRMGRTPTSSSGDDCRCRRRRQLSAFLVEALGGRASRVSGRTHPHPAPNPHIQQTQPAPTRKSQDPLAPAPCNPHLSTRPKNPFPTRPVSRPRYHGPPKEHHLTFF
jgi:hypothetical protein